MSQTLVRRIGHRFAVAILLLAGTISACGAEPARRAGTADDLGYATDEAASSAYERAKREAASQGKRILVVAGGDWCRWCHVLDRFLREHRETDERLHRGFVVVKLAVGENGLGADPLEHLPSAQGYPHFWVLSPEGALIASVNTAPLERGDHDYDTAAFARFLDAYASSPSGGR